MRRGSFSGKMQGWGFNKGRPVFYGWYIALAGLLCYALNYGTRYSFSVIFPCLLEEFGWPRDTTAAMLSIHLLIYGLTAPWAGYLVDWTGPRKMMVFGTLLLALGLVLSRWGSEPGHFYLTFGVLSGAGLCLTGSVPFTTVIRNWFERRRGLVFSIMFLGAGGAFAFYPAIAWLIAVFGWRDTFVVEGLVISGIVVPIIILVIRYHPRDKGLLRDGLREGEALSQATTGEEMHIVDPAWAAVDWTLMRAVRTKRFWFLAVAVFSLWGVMEHLLVTHHVAYAIDMGYSRIYASSILSLFGVMRVFASLAGMVSDWIGREVTITIGALAGISGILVLMLIRDPSHPWMLYFYALSYGFGFGICTPTIVAIVTDIFQGPRVGFVIGAIWLFSSLGGALGPWLGGWLFEIRGNYSVAFALCATLFALACAAFWLAAPRKVRRVRGKESVPVPKSSARS